MGGGRGRRGLERRRERERRGGVEMHQPSGLLFVLPLLLGVVRLLVGGGWGVLEAAGFACAAAAAAAGLVCPFPSLLLCPPLGAAAAVTAFTAVWYSSKAEDKSASRDRRAAVKAEICSRLGC